MWNATTHVLLLALALLAVTDSASVAATHPSWEELDPELSDDVRTQVVQSRTSVVLFSTAAFNRTALGAASRFTFSTHTEAAGAVEHGGVVGACAVTAPCFWSVPGSSGFDVAYDGRGRPEGWMGDDL
jgi:hypothetical protein